MNSLNLGLGSIKTDKHALTPVEVIRKHAKGCLEEKGHLLFIFVDKIGRFRVGHQNIVIIDKKNKKVVFFEPRSKVGSKFADIFRGVDLDLKKDREDISATATKAKANMNTSRCMVRRVSSAPTICIAVSTVSCSLWCF